MKTAVKAIGTVLGAILVYLGIFCVQELDLLGRGSTAKSIRVRVIEKEGVPVTEFEIGWKPGTPPKNLAPLEKVGTQNNGMWETRGKTKRQNLCCFRTVELVIYPYTPDMIKIGSASGECMIDVSDDGLITIFVRLPNGSVYRKTLDLEADSKDFFLFEIEKMEPLQAR